MLISVVPKDDASHDGEETYFTAFFFVSLLSASVVVWTEGLDSILGTISSKGFHNT